MGVNWETSAISSSWAIELGRLSAHDLPDLSLVSLPASVMIGCGGRRVRRERLAYKHPAAHCAPPPVERLV